GLIVPLGRWVLEQALADLRTWDDLSAGPDSGLRVSVNVSVVQFERDPGFIDEVEAALLRHGLANHRLVLEVTESVLMEHRTEVVESLERLRVLGIGLAVDDFGTGSSSLSYLKHLPFSLLKLDKSFVDGVGTDPKDRALVASIVAMSRALGLEVTAEGVETSEQIEALQILGCDRAQGFHYARPMPAPMIDALLATEVADTVLSAS
ncbi:MAG TPA: EAL domain-containing protein, partial [Acidimicrobiales bacterium]|nr:EAL domain-containing protein [Acidimicrobiales bacterium]